MGSLVWGTVGWQPSRTSQSQRVCKLVIRMAIGRWDGGRGMGAMVGTMVDSGGDERRGGRHDGAR